MRDHNNKLRILCDCTLALIGAMYPIVSWVVVEYRLRYVPLCPFYLLTSLHCPLCGMTRSFGRLLHGDITGALTLHPLVFHLFVLWIGFTGTATYRFVREIREIYGCKS